MTDDLNRGLDDADHRDDGAPDADAFGEQFRQQWNASIDKQSGSSALDPALWGKIRREANPRTRHRSRKRPRITTSAHLANSLGQDNYSESGVPSTVPSRQWHRGLLIFASVAVVAFIILFLPGGSVDPQYGGIVREARKVITPVPSQDLGCNVDPLTRNEVFEIVIDPTLFGIINTRELFATPPSSPWAYPHTETWLPESDGIVDMASGSRLVRIPTAKEFRGASEALDRYLRCQSEGTNYQLWALESPVEVQRQIVDLIAKDRGWTFVDSWMSDEITELDILNKIDQFGPEQRLGGNSYLTVGAPEKEVVRANPDVTAAYVAVNPDTTKIEYVWIGTEWVDPESGEVISSRGARLDATPALVDGNIPNLVVMILKYDPGTDAWLIEWLVPTI